MTTIETTTSTVVQKPLFKFIPFSVKQKQLLTWWMDSSPVSDRDGIIADGSVRSGKTLIMSFSYVIWAMENFCFETFIMSGKTIASFRRNVLRQLKLVLFLRGYRVDERRSENMIVIYKGNVENYFYIFGGKDEASQDLVQGLTAAGAFFDEVALMPESYINQAVARCSVEDSKLWFNCNPDGPYHPFKVEWIDKLEEKNMCRLQFELDDNPSLSEKMKERYRSRFSGIFYDRFILGKWVLAEGTIYSMFNKNDVCINSRDLPRDKKGELDFDSYYVGTDYGVTNPMVYLMCGIKMIEGDPHIYILDEYYNKKTDGTKTDPTFVEDYQKFIKDHPRITNIIDPSATSLINLLRQRQLIVKPANNAVIDGISNVSGWLKQKRIHIAEDKCPNILKEFSSYCWDAKKTKLGIDEPIKDHDHALDALRYVINTLYPIKSNRGPVMVHGL